MSPGSLLALALAAGPTPAPRPGLYLGEFRVTYYYIAEEDDRFAGHRRREVLRDRDGRRIARVSTAFRRELDREGTGRLRDGRLLNVAGRRDGQWHYVVLDPPSSGLGAAGHALEPLVTVAADPAHLPLGTRIALPAFAGFERDGGGRHDGDFLVADVGSSIQGPRIDVFLGRRDALERAERTVPSHATTAVFLAAQWACEGRDRP